MKEIHLFYAPEAADGGCELSPEESAHAVRVLRMKARDEIMLTDGHGSFYHAELTAATAKHCYYQIISHKSDIRSWQGHIHLAVAPTKNMDRMEWLVEKATEIGWDRFTPLACDNSERRIIKTSRLQKTAIAAMKQSHKAFLPQIDEITSFADFIAQPFGGQRFIAHCHKAGTDSEGMHLSASNFLGDLLQHEGASLVLIGPEGDFSEEEVAVAVNRGFIPISLGESRLRTETAGLVAVHLMNLAKRISTNRK